MGNGYTRQSTADIVTNANITAEPLNNEFNALQSAFNSTTGHTHDGTSGEGPLINLTTSITGVLPVVNGGIAAIHKIDATAAPTTSDDSGDGYGPGSIWIDVTNDVAYVCVDASVANAVWDRISYNTSLDDISALAKTDGNIIVGDGANWVAESGSTARASLGLVIGTDVQAYDAGLSSIAGLTTAADRMIYTTAFDTYAVTPLTSAGRALMDDADASTQRTTLGLAIGTDVQAYDAGLASIAGLTTSANKMIYTTGSDTYAVTDLSAFARTLLDDADAATMRTTLGVDASGGTINVVNGGTGASTAADARTNLGLGTIATQDSSSVTITGGSITGITDLAVVNGGTGASSFTSGYLIKGAGTGALSPSAVYESGGNVGIGTDTLISRKLHVYEESTATVARFQSGGASCYQEFTTSGGTSFIGQQSSGNLVVRTASTIRMTIDSSGDAVFTGALSAATVAGAWVASQAEAEAGTATDKVMTPERTAQAIAALATNSVKAWVNFNGTGTVAIRSSFNVSSITDYGTGDYGVNFTSALANADYTVVATNGPTHYGHAACIHHSSPTSEVAPTASGFRLCTNYSSGVGNDAKYVSAVVLL